MPQSPYGCIQHCFVKVLLQIVHRSACATCILDEMVNGPCAWTAVATTNSPHAKISFRIPNRPLVLLSLGYNHEGGRESIEHRQVRAGDVHTGRGAGQPCADADR
jgi:hypothetical protein